MLSYFVLNDEIKIEENLEKLRQKKCDTHNKYKASHFCMNPLCINNSLSFLCELCYINHSKDHFNHKEIKYVDEIFFSTKRLTQMKEDCKIDTIHEGKINVILQNLDQIFEKLKETFCNVIDKELNKEKAHILKTFSLDNEYVMKVFKEHEKVLLDLFNKDEILIILIFQSLHI